MNAIRTMEKVLADHGKPVQIHFERRGLEAHGVMFKSQEHLWIIQGRDCIHVRTGRSMDAPLDGNLDLPVAFQQFADQTTIKIESKKLRTIRLKADHYQAIACECGKNVEVVVSGFYMCKSCAADKIAICGYCSCVFPKASAVEKIGKQTCPACAASNFFTCADCNKEFYYDVINRVGGKVFCNDCFSAHFFECSICGQLHPTQNKQMFAGEPHCAACFNRYCRHPREYGFKPEPIFLISSKQSARKIKVERYYGTETEVGNGPDQTSGVAVVNRLMGQMAYCKNDGSIPGYGFEIVTHPMSLPYILENKLQIQTCYEELSRLGYRSHDCGTSSCGLHVHVSKKAADKMTWMKVDFVVNNHPKLFKKFARRACDWGKMVPKEMKDSGKALNDDRRVSLNFLNDHTVEFRLFRGTLKVDTYIATIQLIDMMLDMMPEFSLKEVMDYDLMEQRIAGASLQGPDELRGYAGRLNMFRTALAAEGARSARISPTVERNLNHVDLEGSHNEAQGSTVPVPHMVEARNAAPILVATPRSVQNPIVNDTF